MPDVSLRLSLPGHPVNRCAGGGLDVGSHIDRQTSSLAESYLKGGISRRAFVTRLLALGLAPGAVASVIAACSNPSPSTSSSAAPGELAGNVRFLVGPWSNQEV